jgi:hypothetical protein
MGYPAGFAMRTMPAVLQPIAVRWAAAEGAGLSNSR